MTQPDHRLLGIDPNSAMRGAFAMVALIASMVLWLALPADGALADGVLTTLDPTSNKDGGIGHSPKSAPKPALEPALKTEKTEEPPTLPLVAIIMDDLGYLRVAGRRALNLPGNLSFSFLPNAPYARELADIAHERGKEILLHIPMEAYGDHPMGPGGLTKEMTEAELTESVCASMEAIPYARGLSNHMGSLLTARKKPMRWLMRAMLECGNHLYFVDSQTTGKTVAASIAREHKIPTLERDIFLDHEPNPDAILARISQLVRWAKSRGTALGIAHPYPETLDVLGRVLPRLEERGVAFVPVSALLIRRMEKGQSLDRGPDHGTNPGR